MSGNEQKALGVPFQKFRREAIAASLAGFVLPHSIAGGVNGSLVRIEEGRRMAATMNTGEKAEVPA